MSLGLSWLYACFGVFSGHDFLGTHENSWQYFVLILIFGAYFMKGAPQGWCNTPVLFQNRIFSEVIPAKLSNEPENGALQ